MTAFTTGSFVSSLSVNMRVCFPGDVSILSRRSIGSGRRGSRGQKFADPVPSVQEGTPPTVLIAVIITPPYQLVHRLSIVGFSHLVCGEQTVASTQHVNNIAAHSV